MEAYELRVPDTLESGPGCDPLVILWGWHEGLRSRRGWKGLNGVEEKSDRDRGIE